MGRYAQFRQAIVRRLANGVDNWLQRGVETYQEEHFPDEYIHGSPPNFGHDTDTFSSDWAFTLGDLLSRGLAVALGGRLLREDITVVEGHRHNDYRTDLEWRDFTRVRPLGDSQGPAGPSASKPLWYIANTVSIAGLSVVAHLPEHIESVDLYVRVAQPAPSAPGAPNGWLIIESQLYDLNTSVSIVVRQLTPLSILSVAGGVQHPNRWLGPARVRVDDCAIVRNIRFILVKVNARVLTAGTIGGVWEAKLSRPRR